MDIKDALTKEWFLCETPSRRKYFGYYEDGFLNWKFVNRLELNYTQWETQKISSECKISVKFLKLKGWL